MKKIWVLVLLIVLMTIMVESRFRMPKKRRKPPKKKKKPMKKKKRNQKKKDDKKKKDKKDKDKNDPNDPNQEQEPQEEPLPEISLNKVFDKVDVEKSPPPSHPDQQLWRDTIEAFYRSSEPRSTFDDIWINQTEAVKNGYTYYKMVKALPSAADQAKSKSSGGSSGRKKKRRSSKRRKKKGSRGSSGKSPQSKSNDKNKKDDKKQDPKKKETKLLLRKKHLIHYYDTVTESFQNRHDEKLYTPPNNPEDETAEDEMKNNGRAYKSKGVDRASGKNLDLWMEGFGPSEKLLGYGRSVKGSVTTPTGVKDEKDRQRLVSFQESLQTCQAQTECDSAFSEAVRIIMVAYPGGVPMNKTPGELARGGPADGAGQTSAMGQGQAYSM